MNFKNLIFVAIGIAAVGYWINSKIEERKNLENRNQLEAKFTQDFRNFMSETMSDMKWETELSNNTNDRTQIKPVATIEVERVWLNKRILFAGTLDDVATNEMGLVIKVSHGLKTKIDFLASNIKVELNCPRSLEEKIMHGLKTYSLSSTDSGIAVVSNIKKVKSFQYIDKDGHTVNEITGYGDCVDLMFLGDNALWNIE